METSAMLIGSSISGPKIHGIHRQLYRQCVCTEKNHGSDHNDYLLRVSKFVGVFCAMGRKYQSPGRFENQTKMTGADMKKAGRNRLESVRNFLKVGEFRSSCRAVFKEE